MEHIEPSHEDLDVALASSMHEPEIWVIRPLLRVCLRGRLGDLVDGSRFREGVERALPYLRRVPGKLALSTDGTLFAWNTGNQRRSLARLLRDPSVSRVEWEHEYPAVLRRLLEPRHQTHLARRQRQLSRQLHRHLGIPDRSARLLLDRLTAHATVGIHLARRAIEHHSPERLVIATQHSIIARAMLVAAREAGVVAVYVPHAPAADNRIYRDLPVDVAALRGPREVEHYLGLGADPAGLHVVGAPSLALRTDTAPCPDGPVVVALSPWGPDRVERFMALAAAAITDPFTVCPHPGSDLDYLRSVLPARAQLVEGERTWQVIARGCRAVVQSSSGVATEAMLLGAPVIEVPTNARPPNYPAIAEPYVRMAADAAELRRAVDAFGSEARGPFVEQARTWARGWTAYTGRQAEQRLRALLASELHPTGPLLDGWAPPVA
ncbi:MAG: hypothetical protein EA388_11565 [Nitriliruptor sp.]|nr:MAG: hypothetical protein EA388_11565 [Nitriliruptor sp.]